MIITMSGASVLSLAVRASQAAARHDWKAHQHAKDSVDVACWHIEHHSWGWM